MQGDFVVMSIFGEIQHLALDILLLKEERQKERMVPIVSTFPCFDHSSNPTLRHGW